MRTAAANEDSVVEDGAPLALPAAPALSTRNTVIAAGLPVTVYSSGTDTFIWPQQATPQSGTLQIAANSSLTFFYALGVWYIVAEGSVPGNDMVVSYNGRTGAVTSQLSDVGTLFGTKGQIIGGTGANSSALLAAGTTGQALYSGGVGATGLEWAAPTTIGATVGAPTTGAWLVGQEYYDTNGVVWFCTVSGTPGTWLREGVPAGFVYSTSNQSIAYNTYVQVGGLAVGYVLGGMITSSSTGQTNNQLVVSVAGIYSVAMSVFFSPWATSAASLAQGYILQNGAVTRSFMGPTVVGSYYTFAGTTRLLCAAGDVIGYGTYHNAPTQTLVANGSTTWLAAELVA
jgi:hypothetical protein